MEKVADRYFPSSLVRLKKDLQQATFPGFQRAGKFTLRLHNSVDLLCGTTAG